MGLQVGLLLLFKGYFLLPDFQQGDNSQGLLKDYSFLTFSAALLGNAHYYY